jgi:TolB protein
MSRISIVTFNFCTFIMASLASAQTAPAPTADEHALGDLVIGGSQVEHVTKLAVLRSNSPDYEDVVIRSVVRHDLELSGMFDLVPDSAAPPGTYEFDDPVDLPAWQKLGAEVIVKVAARRVAPDKVEIFSLAYFLDVGKVPVYERRITINSDDLRDTGHRVTDALLAAISGRPGSFASHFTMSTAWGRGRRVLSMDADGASVTPVTSPDDTSIAPFWDSDGSLYFTQSVRYSPFHLMLQRNKQLSRVTLPFETSIYAGALSRDGQKLAVAVAEEGRSNIYVGNSDASGFQKVSITELATSPAFSPNGKLAYIGGGAHQGSQRIYVDGKPVSPNGFTAASPTFCDTELGIRLVYAVAVGGGRMDLVMSDEHGRDIARLTQGPGSNFAPACSPDGRLLAFFSTRKSGAGPGLYLLNLKRFTTIRVTQQMGESLNWARLPDNATWQALEVRSKPKASAPRPAPATVPPPTPAPQPGPSPG